MDWIIEANLSPNFCWPLSTSTSSSTTKSWISNNSSPLVVPVGVYLTYSMGISVNNISVIIVITATSLVIIIVIIISINLLESIKLSST